MTGDSAIIRVAWKGADDLPQLFPSENDGLKDTLMKYMRIVIACTILSVQTLNAIGMAEAGEKSGIKGGNVVHLNGEEPGIPKELLNERIKAYPVLEGMKILCVKRAMPRVGKKGPSLTTLKSLGFPSNHECQSSVKKMMFSNEIGILDLATGRYATLYRPQGKSFVGNS